LRLRLPLEDRSVLRSLSVGDEVYIDGVVVTMRDLGHRRALEMVRRGESLPVDLRNGGVFHAGPIAIREDGSWRIVSIGPTTSARMDAYVYDLVRELGIAVIMGKGGMGPNAARACRDFGCVYLELIGGTASLITRSVKRVLAVHWLDLGIPEAMWVLEVEGLGPCIVSIDCRGNDIHREVLDRARRRAESVVEELLREGLAPARS